MPKNHTRPLITCLVNNIFIHRPALKRVNALYIRSFRYISGRSVLKAGQNSEVFNGVVT